MLIAHDLGTSALKSTLHENDGTIIASAQSPYPTHYGAGATCEQDPQHWWQALVETTGKLLANTNADPAAIEGICVSGHMMGLVVLDEHLSPTRPAMIWSDQRAVNEAAELADLLSLTNSYRLTGHRLGPTYTIAKWMWVQHHEPQSLTDARWVCVAKDYLNARLTGTLVTDHTDASSMGMYDLQTRSWSQTIIAAAGVCPDLLPPIVASTDTVATLSASAAKELGLSTSCRVIAGGGDGVMATIGAGCTKPSDPLYACLGTSAWFACTSSTPQLDDQGRSFTFAHVDPSLYCPCAASQNAGGVLDWLTELFLPNNCDGLAELISEACNLERYERDLVMLPYLLGERSPWWTPHSRGALIGLKRHHSRAHIVRAALEGIGLTLQACMEAVAGGRDVPNEGVDVIGGGARSDAWLQLLATIWGVPVRRRNVVTTANSLGAAVTGLTGLGHLELAAARELSRVEATFLPSDDHSHYGELRERFEAAFRTIEPLDARAAGESEPIP